MLILASHNLKLSVVVSNVTKPVSIQTIRKALVVSFGSHILNMN